MHNLQKHFPAALVLVLTLTLTIPDLSGIYSVSSPLFSFPKNISDTAFYSMLFALTISWAILAYLKGTKYFSFRKIALLLCAIPFLIVVTYFLPLAISLFFRQDSTSRFPQNIYQLFFHYSDLVVVSAFLLLVYFSTKSALLNCIERTFSRLNFGLSLLLAFAFCGVALAHFHPCSSFQCREKGLKEAMPENVYKIVSDYINSSPVIREDIGNKITFAVKRGAHFEETVWLDYDAQMKLEVVGEQGSGWLELMIAGNSSSSIEIFKGTWHSQSRTVPIANEGTIDYPTIRFDLLKEREKEFESLLREKNCESLIELINRNEMEVKQDSAYSLDNVKTTLAKATCLEQEGQNAQAAVEFAKYSFFIQPYPFQETTDDKEKVLIARDALVKAMSLDPNYQYFGIWELTLAGLNIQEKLTVTPCDEGLREELRKNYEARRVIYKTLPACKGSN